MGGYMNKLKIIISYILIILLIPLNVKASGSSGSLDGFTLNGTYTDGNGREFNAYTYNNGDDSALPSGFKYYYKYNNGKVITMERSDVITNILNKKIGIVMEPNKLLEFIADYGSGIVGRNPEYYNNLIPVLKDGSLVGVALNGLSGGTLDTTTGNKTVSIPSTEVNNVYNFYIYWAELPENKQLPEYIVIHGFTKQEAKGYVSTPNSTNDAFFSTLDGMTDIYYSTAYYSKSSNKYSPNLFYWPIKTECYITVEQFATLCNDLSLDINNREVSKSTLLTSTYTGLTLRMVDKETNENLTSYNKATYSNNSFSTQNSTYFSTNAGTSSYCPLFVGDWTIWKDKSVQNQIKNNVYKPTTYNTNNYKNFNTGNNNSYETSTNQIDNSNQDNDNIYNEANTSNNTNITEQIDNSDNSYTNIDNSSVTTNTTTIVNTYYNYYYGDETPENPDSGNGGNGGNDSGNGSGGLEDDSILDALLAAILKLLRAIGKIIATILTGIIDIITEVLTAITNITTSFTGIIEFIGSIFGFLPAECIAVLTLGLTISVLIALIKMFGK